MTFDRAAEQMKEAVMLQCECLASGDYEFKDLMTMVNAQFELQLATLKAAKTKAAGFGRGDIVALDDDDWCGTPPKPRPWPPFLMELLKLQTEVFRTELLANYKLSGTEIKSLDTELNAHLSDFAGLLK